MYDTLPYSIVVPALVLANRPGSQNEAIIDFGRAPLDLGNTFCIEFWFKPDAYPREGATAVVTAYLKTADGGDRVDLVLRLNDQHITPELQTYHGPTARCIVHPLRSGVSKPPPQGKWTHFAVVNNKGKLQLMYWREGRSFYEGSADLNEESYRLTRLVLAAENAAKHSFAELRLWNLPRDYKDLDDFRKRPPDGNAPGLLGYWELDEGSGILMVDSSMGGNDGIIQGGEWQRDSGLALQMGIVNSGGEREISRDGISELSSGHQRAQWIDQPRVDQQIAYLETLLIARQSVMEQEDRQLQAQKIVVAALEKAKLVEENQRAQKQRQLEEELKKKLDAAKKQREEVENRKNETLARIESSQKIRLKDFILRLQDDLTRGRQNIQEQYERVYGLDSVSLEIKVVPGVGGVGLHLPAPDTRIDSGRLSTLKLRLNAVPTEGEEKAKLAEVPWLKGSTEDFARRRLAQAGFRVDAVYQEVTDPVQDGRTLAQIYDALEGNQAELDSVITLVVGRRQ